MSEGQDLPALTSQVLWWSLGLSTVFGAIAQRTHFCTMGAISDVVSMGDWTRLRQWALAMAIAVLGFTTLSHAGLVDPAATLYAAPRWLPVSAAVGGMLFGVGMVLASGCGSKTLVRIGGGSLKSLVVFVVMGLTAFACLKGVLAVVRVATVDQLAVPVPTPARLPTWLASVANMPVEWVTWGCAALLTLGLLAWVLSDRTFLTFENLLAGVGIGGVVTAMWWVTGHLGHVMEHPETLEEVFLGTASGRAEAMSFVAPAAHLLDWLMFFSDRSKVLTVGVVSVVGVVVGSALMALMTRRFRWEGFGGVADLAHHLMGAVLMGTGGVTAMGCTIGQGLSALATLSLGSFVAVPAIFLGAWAALSYQTARLEREA